MNKTKINVTYRDSFLGTILNILLLKRVKTIKTINNIRNEPSSPNWGSKMKLVVKVPMMLPNVLET